MDTQVGIQNQLAVFSVCQKGALVIWKKRRKWMRPSLGISSSTKYFLDDLRCWDYFAQGLKEVIRLGC